MLSQLPQNLVFGLLVGGLYGLAAVGLSLVFGVTKILNVAHGELLMLGGYSAFWLFPLYGVDPFLGLLLPIVFLVLLGLVLSVFSHCCASGVATAAGAVGDWIDIPGI